MTEADDLLNHIRAYVHGRVAPGMEDTVTELVGRTVVLIMSTPSFYLHLRVVQDLQRQVEHLQYQVRVLQAAQRRAAAKKAPAKRAPVKKVAAKAPTVKKAATARPSKRMPSNVRQFKRGASGR